MSLTRQGRYTPAKMSVFSKNRQACTIHVTIIFPLLLKAMLAGDVCEFLPQLNLRKTQCAKGSETAHPLKRFTPQETFKHTGGGNSPLGNSEESQSQPTI